MKNSSGTDGQATLWWLCPFCGETGLGWAARDNSGAHGALQTHIHVSVGNGHGLEYAYPDGFDQTALTEYLTPEVPLPPQ